MTKPPLLTRWRWLQAALGLALGLALFWFALRHLSWAELLGSLVHTRWSWVLVAWAMNLLYTAARAWRWQRLLEGTSEQVSWARALAIMAVGQLGSALLPTRIGELVRAYLAGRASGGAGAAALGTIVVEKALDSLMLVALIAGLGLSIALPDWLHSAALAFASALILMLILIVIASLGKTHFLALLERLPVRLRRLALGAIEGLSVLRQRGKLLSTSLLTLATWALAASTNWFLLKAFALPESASLALLILAAIYLGALIRVAPAQVGVFHYVTILSLNVYAIGPEAAAAYAIVLYALVYVTIILLGVLSLWWLSVDWRAVIARAASIRQEAR